MTMLYPFYSVAVNSSDTYLMAFNYWLWMEKDYGILDKKYDYWVLG